MGTILLIWISLRIPQFVSLKWHANKLSNAEFLQWLLEVRFKEHLLILSEFRNTHLRSS